MALRLIGVDPDSPNNGSPTVWLDEADQSIVIQGDPEYRWASWSGLIRTTVARGVSVRRIRLVSEPVTDYIRFEYDVTAAHNLAAGEQVRWLPRRSAGGLLVPCSDFWLLDDQVVLWNHFAGDGSWVGEEKCDDPAVAKLCAASFEAAWERAIPHEAYQPA